MWAAGQLCLRLHGAVTPSRCPLWRLSQSECRHLALSDLDRRITMLFFIFNVVNTFMGSVFGGGIFQQLGTMMEHPGGVQALRHALRNCGPAAELACAEAGCRARVICCRPPARPPCTGQWLGLMGTALPSASSFFFNCEREGEWGCAGRAVGLQQLSALYRPSCPCPAPCPPTINATLLQTS